MLNLQSRTLVNVSAGKYCLGFRTISRRRKSSREFLVTREELKELERKTVVCTKDMHCFAVMRRNVQSGLVDIVFSWLSESGGRLTGYEETVTIPYNGLYAFERDSAEESGPQIWKVLSVQETARPRLVFQDHEGLCACLENRVIRRKLVRALRDNFNWPSADEIRFYRDFALYSFGFQEVNNGRPGISGGLIFHQQQDRKKSYYAVHT